MSKARTLANLISDNAELADGQISVAEVVGAAPTASPTFTGNIDAGDNVNIRLGDSDDLQIYHDGSDSYIKENGTGNLIVAVDDFRVTNVAVSEVMISADTDGEVKLYHNAFPKLATTATGIQVTGNITNASGDLTLDASGDIILDSGGYDVKLKVGGTEYAKFSNYQNNFYLEPIAQDKDLIIRGNDGGSVITALTLDMSAEGNATFQSATTARISLQKTGSDKANIFFDTSNGLQFDNSSYNYPIKFDGSSFVFNEQSNDSDFRVESNNNSNMLFVDGGSNRVGVGRDPQDNGSTLQVAEDATVSTDLQLTLRGLSNENKKLLLGFDTTANIGTITSLEAGVTHRPLHLQGSEFVWNESGSDHDFRIESDSHTHVLFVDGGNNVVGINTATPSYLLDVGNGSSSPAGGKVMRINSQGDTIFSLSKAGTSLFSMRNNSQSYTALTSNNSADLLLGYSTSDAGAISDHLRFRAASTIFNEDGANRDFRVESNNNANMLLVDAENDRVKIGSSSGSGHFNVCVSDSATDPLIAFFQQKTNNKDARVQINTQANDGGDPYLKLDAGGSNMIVGLNWHGTDNNKLKLGSAERPSDTIKGITISGLGDVSSSATGYEGSLDSTDTGKVGHRLSRTGSHIMQRNANSTGAETIIVNNIHSSGASIGMVQYRTRNSVEGSLNGNSSGLYITNNSDYRKKENITDATGCLTKITGLRPVTYTHRSEYDTDTTTVHTGFIAHEVSDHMPSIVEGAKDAVDDEGNAVLQSVAYSNQEIITNLVGAIKELEARITALENA